MGTPRRAKAGPALGMRDMVESALEQEDIMPLVRLVFDTPTLADAAGAKSGVRDPGTVPDGSADEDDDDEADTEDEEGRGARRKRGRDRGGGGIADSVLAMLQKVAEEQAEEISQVCRSNADEIAGSLAELEAMQASVREFRGRIGQSYEQLQSAGEGFLRLLDMLQEASRVQAAIRESRKSVAVAIRLLQMTAAAGHFLQENRLYKSHRLLQRVRDALPATDDVEEAASRATAMSGTLTRTISSKTLRGTEPAGAAPQQQQAAKAGAAVGGGGGCVKLGNLRNFLRARVDEVSRALEARAVSDFNDWLVSVRGEARSVGMRVLMRAAAERAREEAAMRERRALAAHLPASPLEGMPPAALQGLGAGEAMPKLDSKANPAAALLLMASPPPGTNNDVLGAINMTLLHRCLQVHQCLGQLPAFSEAYTRNRRLQLNSDLAPPANFADGYQGFIAQVTGFFVIEDRVQRRCPELAADMQADAEWETAVAVLKTVLTIAFDSLTSPRAMLRMKDFVLLVCSALGNCGYHVVPVQEILMAGRAKYQELLCTSLAAALAAQACLLVAPPSHGSASLEELAAWAHESSLLPAEVPDQATAREYRGYGLPLSLRDDAAPGGPPFAAPFSGVVPLLARLARGFVEDTCAYLTCLVSPAEVLPLARAGRDRMLSRVVLDGLQRQIAGFGAKDLGRAMQLVADTWALAAAMPALDDFTLQRLRGDDSGGAGEQRSAQTGTSGHAAGAHTMQAAWAGVQEAAERAVVRVMAGQAAALLSQARAAPWLPELPPRATAPASPYVSEILTFLEDSLNLGRRMLPGNAHLRVACAVAARIGDSVMELLTDEAIPAYNMYALFRLAQDLARLKGFADSCTDVPDMAEGFAEPDAFLHLMTNAALEELCDANRRAQRYSCFNVKRLLLILAKYREVGDKASYTGSHSVIRSKQPEARPLIAGMPPSFLKRKQVDKVMKALRGIAE